MEGAALSYGKQEEYQAVRISSEFRNNENPKAADNSAWFVLLPPTPPTTRLLIIPSLAKQGNLVQHQQFQTTMSHKSNSIIVVCAGK